MADVERSVKIAFEGDDRISPVIDTINGKMNSFASSVQGVTGPMADLAAGVLKLEAAFALLAAAGLAYALTKSMEFENATIELQKVIGDEGGKIDEARQSAIALSDAYGESASSILLSTANFKQAGFDIQESFTLTKAAMDLVIAGNLSAGESSEYLISILKGFKAPGEEAARVVDILNEVSNNYATDVRQLAIGMAELSPIAKLMGFSFEETAGILTPVIEVFRDGGEAANGLKTGLLKLVDDRTPVVEALKAIGVSQFDLNGNLRSGKDILFDVSKAFVNLSDEQKIFFAQQLAGIEQGARMVEVFNGLAKSQEVTAAAMGATGSAAAEVALRLESATASIDKFKAGFENLGIIVGDQFRLAAKEAVDGGTAIEIALRNAVNAGSFAPIFEVLNQFSSDIGATLQQVAKNLPAALANVDFSEFLNAIKSLGGEFQGLFEAFFGEVDLTTTEGLQLAIQKVVDGLTALTNVAAGIMSSWQPFVETLGKAATEFANMSPEAQKTTGEVLGFGQAIDKILEQVDVFTGALNFIGGAMVLLGASQIPAAVTGFKALLPLVVSLTSALGPLGSVTAAIVAGWALDTVLDNTLPKWKESKDAIAETALNLSGASEGMGEWIGSAEAAATATTETVDELEKLSKSLFDLPDEKQITFDAIDRASPEFKAILAEVQKIPTEKVVDVSAKANTASIAATKQTITTTIMPDGLIVLAQVNPNQESIDKTKAAIGTIPEKKIIEMTLQGEIDKQLATIKANADTVQTAMKWKAEIEMTSIKEAQETLRSFSDNTTAMFKNTGDVISAAIGQLGELEGLDKYHVEDIIKADLAIRQALAESQIKMNNFQMDYIKARTDAMNRGDGMITINATGLEPEAAVPPDIPRYSRRRRGEAAFSDDSGWAA
jgi:TP901 family phage tail tape measure protein